MKKTLFSIMAMLAILSSCNKEGVIVEVSPSEAGNKAELIEKTFSATMLDTKTSLDGDGLNILWSAGDEINVIGVTDGGTKTSHRFTIASGQGTRTATFTGEVNLDETSFYALYPYNSVSWSGSVMTSDNINTSQTATAGSFDKAAAELVGVADGSGNITFTHGRAYFKFVMGSDNVTAVKFTSSGARLASKNKYNMPACTINSTGGDQTNDVTLSGTFEKGTTYYVALPLHKNALGTISVEYTFSGGAKASLSTTSLSAKKMSENAGKVYNLGTIEIDASPAISASDVVIEATDEGGTVNFTVSNLEVGGYVEKSITSSTLSNDSWGDVSFNSSTGEGSVTFTCDANDDTENAKTAVLHIVYKSSGGSELATKDVTITQKKAAAAGASVYYYFYTTSLTNTDGKFTPSATPGITFDGTTSNCGVSSFIIDGNTCTKGLKLDSGGYLDFTTSSDVTASVTFYYACRKSDKNSTAKIQIKATSPSGDATVYDSFNTFGTINSQTVALSPSTTYRISRNNQELALVYVALTETPN